MAAGAGVGIGVSGLGIQESWAQHQWFRTVGNENCCSGYISCLSLRPMGSGQVGWRSRRGCRCISRLAYPGLPRLASVVVVVVVAHTQSQPYSVRASAAAASSISSITLSRSLAFWISFSLLPPASASRPAFQPPPRHLQPHPLAKHARCFPADSQPSLILSWWLVYHCQTSPAEKSLPILRDPRKVRLNSPNSNPSQSIPSPAFFHLPHHLSRPLEI